MARIEGYAVSLRSPALAHPGAPVVINLSGPQAQEPCLHHVAGALPLAYRPALRISWVARALRRALPFSA